MKHKMLFNAVAGCIIFSFMGCSGGTAQESTSGAAPDFTLNDSSGKPVNLSSFRGNVIIIDFFASWCPPCRKEIPDFVALADQYGKNGFTMIGVSLEAPGPTQRFIQEVGISYPVLIDDGTVSNAYGPIQAIPTTVVIDRGGTIVRRYVGYRPKQVFEADIQSLL